jgi:hypothetical protein
MFYRVLVAFAIPKSRAAVIKAPRFGDRISAKLGGFARERRSAPLLQGRHFFARSDVI